MKERLLLVPLRLQARQRALTPTHHTERCSSGSYSIPPFPVLSGRGAGLREQHTPEKIEGLTPGHAIECVGAPCYGSPGFGMGASRKQGATIKSPGLTPRLEAQSHVTHQPKTTMKIKYPKNVRCRP